MNLIQQDVWITKFDWWQLSSNEREKKVEKDKNWLGIWKKKTNKQTNKPTLAKYKERKWKQCYQTLTKRSLLKKERCVTNANWQEMNHWSK